MLLNGNITSDGMIVTYTCEQGYSLNGTQTRYCRQDGTGWDGEPPTCGKIQFLLMLYNEFCIFKTFLKIAAVYQQHLARDRFEYC